MTPVDGRELVQEYDTAEGSPEGVPPEQASPATADPDVADTATDEDPAALEDFNADLEPYGSWREHGEYGTVWTPSREAVGDDFAPYVSRGHWALTASGQWLWVSDYPFGHVVFHYGRWVYVSDLGWSWVPGRRYAPAWVVFRTSYYGDPYIGWAPMPPRYIWRNGRLVWLSHVPPYPYVFCHTSSAFNPHLARYVLRDRNRTRRLAERSRPYVTTRATAAPYRSPSVSKARVATENQPAERVTRVRVVPPRSQARVLRPSDRAEPRPASAAALRRVITPPAPPAPVERRTKVPAAKSEPAKTLKKPLTKPKARKAEKWTPTQQHAPRPRKATTPARARVPVRPKARK